MGFVLYLFIRLVCNSIEFCIYNPLSVQIGFILTVLLSLAVLLTIITDKIPSTSIEVSILCKANTINYTGFKFTFQRFSTWIQAKEMSFSTTQFTSRCIQTFTWQGCCKSGPMIWSRTMTFTYLLCNLFNFIEGWYFAPVLIRIKYFCTLNKVNNHRHLVI